METQKLRVYGREKTMKKHKILEVTLLSATLLFGCGNKETTSQTEEYHLTGPQLMEVIPAQEASGISEEGASGGVLAPIRLGEAVLQEVYGAVSDAAASDREDSSKEGNGDVNNGGGMGAEDLGFGDPLTMNNTVGGRELPIYCVDTQENKIALSFDAAWGAEDTEQILETLKKHDIHVTFFATGGWVESYPEDVKAVLAAGHDLGNHSASHLNMSELSDEEKKEELMSVHEKVKELTGYEMFLFRPPYGDYDNAVVNVAKDCGYYAIRWDVDSLDWLNRGVDSIIETVTKHKNLGNGSIILCHNGADYTAQALDELITKLKEQGYEIVPVSELIYRENFYLNYEGRQIAEE